MVAGAKRHSYKQFFYVFDIKNEILYMNGIGTGGTIFNYNYLGWSVDRKADADEIKEFYELLERFDCVVDENLRTIRKKIHTINEKILLYLQIIFCLL